MQSFTEMRKGLAAHCATKAAIRETNKNIEAFNHNRAEIARLGKVISGMTYTVLTDDFAVTGIDREDVKPMVKDLADDECMIVMHNDTGRAVLVSGSMARKARMGKLNSLSAKVVA
jgi:malonyl CoA-acyl carrier protein transacylase